jgi:hypothetical protein
MLPNLMSNLVMSSQKIKVDADGGNYSAVQYVTTQDMPCTVLVSEL